MSYTPGPWHIQKYNGGRKLYVNASNEQIAHVLYTETRGIAPERREANAHLIAAAPELLVACLRLLSACDAQTHHKGVSGEVLTVMEEARLAIAKAVSEPPPDHPPWPTLP